MAEETCVDLKKNIGEVKCGELPALPRLMITTPVDFKLAAVDYASEAALKTALQNAIVAGKDVRVYLWPQFVGFENASEDAVYEETPLSDLAVRNGKYRFRFHIRKNLCLHKAMFSHNANSGRVFIIDINNKLFGTKDATTGDIYGFTMNMLQTEKLMISDGTVSTKSPVYVVLADSNEIDQNGVMLSVPFINTLKRLTDVDLAQVGSATDSALTVSVKTSCDGVGITGLLTADFVGTDAAGDPIVISGATDNGDGTYDLASSAAFEDGGEITLRSAASLTIKAYEALTPAVIDAT